MVTQVFESSDAHDIMYRAYWLEECASVSHSVLTERVPYQSSILEQISQVVVLTAQEMNLLRSLMSCLADVVVLESRSKHEKELELQELGSFVFASATEWRVIPRDSLGPSCGSRVECLHIPWCKLTSISHLKVLQST